MKAPEEYIVDAILNKSAARNIYQNQIEMLGCLYTGIRSLYDICKTKENEVAEKNPKPNMAQGYKDMCEGKVEPEFFDLLPCYHHWFSNSVINYARLAGYLVGMANKDFTKYDQTTREGKKKIKESCDKYIYSIPEIADVLEYRNIVSAHFALTMPYNKDNFLTMDISAKNICGFRDNRIVSKAGGHVNIQINEEISLTGQQEPKPAETKVTVEDIPIWSITQTFEELLPRYWPNVILPVEKYQITKIRQRAKLNSKYGLDCMQNERK